MILVLLFDRDGRLVDTACSRRYHASIKSRQTSSTGDERQNKRKSGPSPADSLNESQLAAPVGTISFASDVTDEPNQNSKPQCAARSQGRRVRRARRALLHRDAGGFRALPHMTDRRARTHRLAKRPGASAATPVVH